MPRNSYSGVIPRIRIYDDFAPGMGAKPRQLNIPVTHESHRPDHPVAEQTRRAKLRSAITTTVIAVACALLILTMPAWVPVVYDILDLPTPTTSSVCGTGQLRTSCSPDNI